MPSQWRLAVLLGVLVGLPIVYGVISYAYLVWWHNTIFLWWTLIHENGRLTLLGSLFYVDHFIACVPMVVVLALCTAGGMALTGQAPRQINAARAAWIARWLLLGAALLVIVAGVASLYAVGWQRTIDYALQRIERDGVLSRGGNWHQLQLSNVPIALATVGIGGAIAPWMGRAVAHRDPTLQAWALICLAVAALIGVSLSAGVWCGWHCFLNPRWLAHSLRELATYPFTGIPIALASVLCIEYALSGLNTWVLQPRLLSFVLIGAGVVLAAGEFLLLKNTDVLALAQKPAFAPHGLSIPYLLCAHVFEHFLDFVLIGPLAGGFYALVRWSALRKAA